MDKNENQATEVYLNSKFVGTVENPKEFVDKVVSGRRKGTVTDKLNVMFNEKLNQVQIELERGRVRRPLIVVKEGKSTLLDKHLQQLEKNEIVFSDLAKQGVIEYLDSLEEEAALVAFTEDDLTPEHTHLEISAMNIFGLCGSMVPFANHSPGARIAMGAKNQKQALGFYAANFPVRMDMDVNVLHTPQRPIVKTLIHDLSDYDSHPSGQNLIVAVMAYKGYNMEDAIIVNKGSVDRGLGRSTYFRPAIVEELRYAGGLTDEVSIPDKEVKGYKSEHDYRMLEEDGIIYPESIVKEGDVLIGKTSPPRFLSGMNEYSLASTTRRESSFMMKHGEKGVVDFVALTENEEGNKLVQVRLRDQRIPEIGDKFTSRHGQKGVVGLLVPHTDMPYSAAGMVPDIIFSPHGVPSRMTVSHLIELIGGKVGGLSGRYIDGTTFDGEPEKQLRKQLVELGFRENGTETMYNGETGERFVARIYIGNLYYLKLKHMVANKIHSRARGPIQLLTRQPTEGRSKEGGLRLGEMEKDTFVAHGSSLLLKERFDSDRTVVPVCEGCGVVAVYNEFKDQSLCPICGDNVEITDVEMSYAFKLILDEFKSLGIYPRLKLQTKY